MRPTPQRCIRVCTCQTSQARTTSKNWDKINDDDDDDGNLIPGLNDDDSAIQQLALLPLPPLTNSISATIDQHMFSDSSATNIAAKHQWMLCRASTNAA